MRALASMFLGLLLAAGVAVPAQAQLGARSIEVTPLVSYMSFDDDIGLDSHVGFGARLGYNFTDAWGLEGTFNFVPNVDPDTGFDDVDDLLPQTTVWLAHGNLVYNFNLNQSRLVPFVTAGGGVANFNIDNDDDIDEESETDGEVNAGGGLKMYLTPTVALRADARHHWIFASIPNEDVGDTDDEKDATTTSNWELAGGLSFNF